MTISARFLGRLHLQTFKIWTLASALSSCVVNVLYIFHMRHVYVKGQ